MFYWKRLFTVQKQIVLMTFRWNHFLNPDFFCIEKLFVEIVFYDTNQQSWDNTHKNSFDDYVQKILHKFIHFKVIALVKTNIL